MQIDHVSLKDISIFQAENDYSIYNKCNFARTSLGTAYLQKYFSSPFSNTADIIATQQILKNFISLLGKWPGDISNGTIVVIEKFLEYPLDDISDSRLSFNNLTYGWLHPADYSMLKYSVKHFSDFFRELSLITKLLTPHASQPQLEKIISRSQKLLANKTISDMANSDKTKKFSYLKNLQLANKIRYEIKSEIQELIDIYGRIDAWYSMAKAVDEYNLCFPNFVDSAHPVFNAGSLYHLLLSSPVPYDVRIEKNENFIFLTGANMAGKSTFIKTIGSAAYLAHIGMGLPAASCEISLFDGLLSNIDVTDNIAKGESYFYNEVQRIKNTIQKINNGKKWLVLIDELFKGTNIYDAMKCSLAVIKGLSKVQNSMFILSTHLYEIADELAPFKNITFKYFETNIETDQLRFNYQLKSGISNDRIGYAILKREGVVGLLDSL